MIRVAISYRVLQAWRAPVFALLAKQADINLCVFYGSDFEGTKVKSFSGPTDFDTVRLSTFPLKIPTRNGIAYIPLTRGLWKGLQKFDPDVIITEGASHLVGNITAFLFARLFGKKVVQWGLGELRNRKKSVARRVVDLFFKPIERHSDGAIAYSSFGAEYYKKTGLSPDRVFTAVNVVDTTSRRAALENYCQRENLPLPSLLPSTFHLLYVGALSENKNVDVLLQAFANLQNSVQNIRLSIIGEGANRKNLESLVKTLSIGSRVKFVGHIDRGIEEYFYKASILVMPGLGGLVVSDSLCHGVPVICGVGDGCERDLIDGTNGMVIEKMSVKRLTKELQTLYHHPEILETWRSNAYHVIDERYNIENYINVITDCIRKTYAR